jgi:hypothetical protein
MTVPPQGSPHHELRRRIAGCRERLRKARTAQRQLDQAAPTAEHSVGDEAATADPRATLTISPASREKFRRRAPESAARVKSQSWKDDPRRREPRNGSTTHACHRA